MLFQALTKIGVLNVPVWYEAGAMELTFTNTITLAVTQVRAHPLAGTRKYVL